MLMILVGHLLLALPILAMAVYFKKKQPAKINAFVGYRTRASMKNEAAWKEANRFSAELQFKLAIVFVFFEVLSYFVIGGIESFYVCSAFLTVASISVIPITEYQLKRQFSNKSDSHVAI